MAIQKARTEMNFLPDTTYDYENPRPLELPDQSRSLIVGYHWLTGNTPSGKATLAMDFKHLNAKGCYIANAVWFEMFTGRSIAENSFVPEFASAEDLTPRFAATPATKDFPKPGRYFL